jgi:hypothetical protein
MVAAGLGSPLVELPNLVLPQVAKAGVVIGRTARPVFQEEFLPLREG